MFKAGVTQLSEQVVYHNVGPDQVNTGCFETSGFYEA